MVFKAALKSSFFYILSFSDLLFSETKGGGKKKIF